MPQAIQILLGGFGPSITAFSSSLTFNDDKMAKQSGYRVHFKYVCDIMDLGYE